MIKIKMTKVDYTCARCTYTCSLKKHIIQHFNRKSMCPKVNDIVLTDEIKEAILRDRVYHVSKSTKITKVTNITNNNITNNNNNTQNNNILNYNQMEPEEKIEKLYERFKREIPNLTENFYFKRMRTSLVTHKDRKDCDDNECRTIEDLFKEIHDFLTSFLTDEDNKNIYNCFIKSNMFHIYECDEWDKRTVPKGLKQFVKHMKTLIFDAYEVCLIRQTLNWKIRMDAKKALKEYYSFIISFDNLPTFKETRNNDNKLLYNKNDHEYDNDNYSSLEIIDQLNDIWMEVEKTMKDYKKNKNATQLKQIITNHSEKTMKNLDDVCHESNQQLELDLF